MKKLLLDMLACEKTEDWTGGDECRLEIFVDGQLQPFLKNTLNDGQKWTLNISYEFSNAIDVKLWDEDSPDGDYFLGGITIGTRPQNQATALFTQQGARYTLLYSVTEISGPNVDPLQHALSNFQNSSAAGVWPFISKPELLGDIRRTVANPFNVSQEATVLCGPAAILFELASRQPVRYVEVCQQLYETGEFKSRSKIVRPSKTLRESRVPSGITLADWILMATLRDTENAIFDVEATSGPIAMGITTPWEMKGWTFEILAYDKVAYQSTYLYGEFEAMREASNIVKRGGVAFLMIHSAMLGQEAPAVAFPNHWISFLGGLQIDDGVWHRWDSGHIKFDCYSWGAKHHVDLGEEAFEDYMWGVVTGVK
jgi:hypothetical protein